MIFGVYRPRRALVALISLDTLFVGVVFCLVLALSDPFQGATAVDSAPLEYVFETMAVESGDHLGTSEVLLSVSTYVVDRSAIKSFGSRSEPRHSLFRRSLR